MLGLSYGEIFLILGATTSLIGPKDLPIIARAAGRLAGRAVGHVQTARGHLQDVLQMSQARQAIFEDYASFYRAFRVNNRGMQPYSFAFQFTHAEAIQAVGAEIVHSSKKLVDLQVKLKF